MKQILSFTLNDKGAFVREVLLEELSKGLDALGLATIDSLRFSVTASLPFSGLQSISLMTDEDINNLRTLRRLILLLSGSQRSERTRGDINYQKKASNGASPALYQPVSVQELQPLLTVIPELPQDLQQKLLQLPADLAGKLVSRVVARTIRRVFL